MKTAAILGLGDRGRIWASAFARAGWSVRAFDPDISLAPDPLGDTLNRETRISRAVQNADWVAVCLPERIELMQKVMQRAQAEAPSQTVFGVSSLNFGIEDIQACTLRPGSVVLVHARVDGSFAFDVSSNTSPDTGAAAKAVLTHLAAHNSVASQRVVPFSQSTDAESA